MKYVVKIPDGNGGVFDKEFSSIEEVNAAIEEIQKSLGVKLKLTSTVIDPTNEVLKKVEQ